jgi:NAD(P)H-flavin reductase/ferredoxin
MTFEIRVEDSEVTFPCEQNETILDAAERAGYTIPYSCRKGVCMTCKGKLSSGAVKLARSGHARAPCADIFYCIAMPLEPVEIAPQWIAKRATAARSRFTAVVYKISHPAPDVTILHLRFPVGRRVRFRAGQHIKLYLDDGESRNYSLANAPKSSDVAELHVRRLPDGRFSDKKIGMLERDMKLDIELPYGLFFLSDHNEAPALLLATGTGFAPLKSIIDDLIQRRIQKPVHLFWGGRYEADIYQMAVVERWMKQLPWFSFTPVLTQPDAAWTGAKGRIQDAVFAQYQDLSQHEVYACGSPAMISAVRALLIQNLGLAESKFYSDAFVSIG